MATLRKQNSRDTTAPLVDGTLGVQGLFISRDKTKFVTIRIGKQWDEDVVHLLRMTQAEAIELVQGLQARIAKNDEEAAEYEERYGARDYWKEQGQELRNLQRELEHGEED